MESNALTSAWSTISRTLPLYLAARSCWFAMYQSRFALSGSTSSGAMVVSSIHSLLNSITQDSVFYRYLWSVVQPVHRYSAIRSENVTPNGVYERRPAMGPHRSEEHTSELQPL